MTRLYRSPTRDLLTLAAAARRAIIDGGDPLLMLSYVVWPTEGINRKLAA